MSRAEAQQIAPIWYVPHRRNRNFTGRVALLSDLRATLSSGRTAAVTQAISGLGGVGKTQLALEYAYRNQDAYGIVWWLPAEQPATLADGYARLAVKLNLPERDEADQSVIVQAVCRALAQRSDWLLIFDNAPGPEAVRDYLPQGEGHVLITSRDPNFSGEAQVLPLQVWRPEEAVEFLLRRTGQQDDSAAEALARALGYLPLALEHAAAYCEQTRRSLQGYLDLYRKEQVKLFRQVKPPAHYEATVAATWSLAFEQLSSEPLAADLLNLCSFLGPDNIPYDLLRPALNDPEDLAFDAALAALRRYSLAEVGAQALSVHRLVQAVTRDRLSKWFTRRKRRVYADRAVKAVNRLFPQNSDDVHTWPECARLFPHVEAAAEHAELYGVAGEVLSRLLNQLGLYLHGRGEYATARAASERALYIGEATYGPEHPKVAIYASNLGTMLRDLGDLIGAKAAYERAVQIDEAAYGPEHPEMADALSNLGTVLRDLGDLVPAKVAYERALRIGEATYGSGHPIVAIYVNNLGTVLRQLGDLIGAKAAYERALRIGEATYGLEHPQVAIYVNNFGVVLQALDDLAGAQANYERALYIGEAAYGPEHPEIAIWINNLGHVLRDTGDLVGAKAAFERAYRISVRFLGEDHPSTRIVRRNLESVGGSVPE